jgi:hypothetical protein
LESPPRGRRSKRAPRSGRGVAGSNPATPTIFSITYNVTPSAAATKCAMKCSVPMAHMSPTSAASKREIVRGCDKSQRAALYDLQRSDRRRAHIMAYRTAAAAADSRGFDAAGVMGPGRSQRSQATEGWPSPLATPRRLRSPSPIGAAGPPLDAVELRRWLQICLMIWTHWVPHVPLMAGDVQIGCTPGQAFRDHALTSPSWRSRPAPAATSAAACGRRPWPRRATSPPHSCRAWRASSPARAGQEPGAGRRSLCG